MFFLDYLNIWLSKSRWGPFLYLYILYYIIVIYVLDVLRVYLSTFFYIISLL